MRAFVARRDESWLFRLGRGIIGLIITGLMVEIALVPIALFHFHKAGLYGALANVVAIPLTTFVVMPLEALALLFDSVGLGAPFWWVTGQALNLLLALAHGVADTPGAVTTLPSFPAWGFALAVFGGLWLLLWRTRWRRAGIVPVVIGFAALFATAASRPTRDQRRAPYRGGHSRRQLCAAPRPRGRFCPRYDVGGGGYRHPARGARATSIMWHATATSAAGDRGRASMQRVILASRGNDRVEGADMASACVAADVVISDRWLPRECIARWLTARSRQPRRNRRAGALSGGETTDRSHATRGRRASLAPARAA